MSPLLKNLLTLLTQCDTLQAVPCKVSHCVKSVSREATPPGTRREACPPAARQEWRTTGSYLRRTSEAEQPPCQSAATRYRPAEFGRSSEKLTRETEQLELELETLETDQAERLATASPEVAAAVETAAEPQKPARRPLPFLTW